VELAADALRKHDCSRFGELMYDSHRSLREDYEVTCEELDLMVNLAREVNGVYGARMTGGGFGGCTITLVADDAVERFQRSVADAYRERTGIKPMLYVTAAHDGAGEVVLAG
jgi:galactokinase